MKLELDVKYSCGQEVYRKSDNDKSLYTVIGYMVDHKDVLYRISGNDGVFNMYYFEIDDYGNRWKNSN
jgi:hypothetical protein